jgi:NDP-sugar pyrophosphorylase family protein
LLTLDAPLEIAHQLALMGPTLVVMAAGLATRFGGPKQLVGVGPAGEVLFDYAVFDAVRAGFARVVFVIRPDMAATMEAHAATWYGGRVAVAFAEQRVDAGRTKPWGTGHAVLAARALLNGPFGVCNADDYYGPAAFALLAEQLEARGDIAALVGYRLDQTLSEQGGVSRGVCEVDRAGMLTRITEATLVGTTEPFPGDAVASMNLWGFPAGFPALLEERFRAFLERAGRSDSAEFLLSAAVNELVAAGRLPLRVLQTSEPWFGMTHAGDLPVVRARLAALVRAGTYPSDLRCG